MMERTANSNRKHIALFGRRNAGKSSLFNLILEQNISLVSDF
ncbi:MAG: 50S ribosome-binding GTPase, partial [Leptotrichiaceae bacterium]|nr:50S ribosome-binding GTPase [Leptotrichiaceae bacterium]